MNLTITVPWSASLAVYGRRNSAPRVTQHEFASFVRAGRVERTARLLSRSARSGAEELLVNVTLTEHLAPGRWFLAVLNDGDQTAPVRLAMEAGEPGSLRCPGDCSGQGSCHLGVCTCRPGRTGDDCATSEYTQNGPVPVVCTCTLYRSQGNKL